MQRLALFDLDNTLINLDEAFDVWLAEFAEEYALGAEAIGWLPPPSSQGVSPPIWTPPLTRNEVLS